MFFRTQCALESRSIPSLVSRNPSLGLGRCNIPPKGKQNAQYIVGIFSYAQWQSHQSVFSPISGNVPRVSRTAYVGRGDRDEMCGKIGARARRSLVLHLDFCVLRAPWSLFSFQVSLHRIKCAPRSIGIAHRAPRGVCRFRTAAGGSIDYGVPSAVRMGTVARHIAPRVRLPASHKALATWPWPSPWPSGSWPRLLPAS